MKKRERKEDIKKTKNGKKKEKTQNNVYGQKGRKLSKKRERRSVGH
jgi:hypothetical protein